MALSMLFRTPTLLKSTDLQCGQLPDNMGSRLISTCRFLEVGGSLRELP
jgi:hypothetical protein